MKIWISGLMTGVVLLSLGCATPSSYEEAFSPTERVKGNVESIPASMEITWASSMEVLSQQGFLVQQSDAKSRIILASREMRDPKKKDYTYTVAANLTFVPLGDRTTRVMVAANQTTEFHRKEYRWWKLLWIVPLFPTGTDYTSVVVNRDTVHEPQFYNGFFVALKKSCEEAMEMNQPASPPVSHAKATPSEPVSPSSVAAQPVPSEPAPVQTVPVPTSSGPAAPPPTEFVPAVTPVSEPAPSSSGP